jgi:hypothetical protein
VAVVLGLVEIFCGHGSRVELALVCVSLEYEAIRAPTVGHDPRFLNLDNWTPENLFDFETTARAPFPSCAA